MASDVKDVDANSANSSSVVISEEKNDSIENLSYDTCEFCGHSKGSYDESCTVFDTDVTCVRCFGPFKAALKCAYGRRTKSRRRNSDRGGDIRINLSLSRRKSLFRKWKKTQEAIASTVNTSRAESINSLPVATLEEATKKRRCFRNQFYDERRDGYVECKKNAIKRGKEDRLIQSRKMILLDKYIGRALFHLYRRSVCDKNHKNVFIIRRDMNSYDVSAIETPFVQTNSQKGSYDGCNVLMRLISSVMKNIQQRNLNAKHSASVDSHRDVGNDLYIGLNKSLNKSAQRKIVEICCAVKRDNNETVDIAALRDCSISHLVLGTYENRTLVYLTTTRKRFNACIDSLRSLPRMVFCSAKNLIFLKATSMKKMSYLCNFLTYHTFHECDRSFDTRRLGSSRRDMIVLLLFLGVINAKLLRVDKRRNVNLALNMQSLGKAYDNPGFHIFSENSIQHVRKSFNDNDGVLSSLKTQTDGNMINRFLGKVSRIGINARTLRGRL